MQRQTPDRESSVAGYYWSPMIPACAVSLLLLNTHCQRDRKSILESHENNGTSTSVLRNDDVFTSDERRLCLRWKGSATTTLLQVVLAYLRYTRFF